MAKLALGAGTTVTAAATTVVAAAGAVAWFAVQSPDEASDAAQVVEAAQPAVQEPEATPAPEPETEAAEIAEERVLADPTFDVVQVEEDGQTLVAGVAEAGDEVDILIDDAVAGTATADASGRFVTFLSVDPSDSPRVMELRAGRGDDARRSAQTVIISPFTAPAETELAALPTPPAKAPEPAEASTETDVVVEPEVEQVAEAEPETPEVEIAEAEPEPEAAPIVEEAAEETAVAVVEEAPAPVVEPVEDQVAALSTEPQQTEAPAVAAAPVQVTEEILPEPEIVTETEVAEAPAPEPETPEPEVAPQATAPAVLLADSEGVQVLQSPQPLVSVALDSITYDQTGDVSLSGRSTSDGFVRIYLDDQPVIVSRITQDGRWRTELPSVDTGVYQLRVDELDDDGNVLSRIETPFQREEPELVAELQTEQLATGVLTQDVLTVQPGATLWAIARERYGEGTLFVKVFEANRDRIRDPDLIYPGQVFDLPN